MALECFDGEGDKTEMKAWRTIRRLYCRLAHEGIMFAGGRRYECRTCGENFENPALNGSMLPLARPQSVRIVPTPKKKKRERVAPIKRRA